MPFSYSSIPAPPDFRDKNAKRSNAMRPTKRIGEIKTCGNSLAGMGRWEKRCKQAERDGWENLNRLELDDDCRGCRKTTNQSARGFSSTVPFEVQARCSQTRSGLPGGVAPPLGRSSL